MDVTARRPEDRPSFIRRVLKRDLVEHGAIEPRVAVAACGGNPKPGVLRMLRLHPRPVRVTPKVTLAIPLLLMVARFGPAVFLLTILYS